MSKRCTECGGEIYAGMCRQCGEPYVKNSYSKIKESDIARPVKHKSPPSEAIKTFAYALVIIEGLSTFAMFFYNVWIALYIVLFATISTFILYLWARTAETHESIDNNLSILIDRLVKSDES